MEVLEEKKKSKAASLLSLIREYKETYVSDDEDSDDDSKDDPFLIENSLREFTGNALYSDVVFIVENENKELERIPAHRMLLAVRSAVFEAMLYPNPELEQINVPTEIHIKDTRADIFRLLLESIYTDKPHILAHQVVDSVRCAQKYQVASFTAACHKYMNHGLSHENACELLMCASKEDRTFAMQFIEENCEEVVMHDPHFTDLPREVILEIVRSNKLCVTEVELFKGILAWSKAECKRQKIEATQENLKDILQKILVHIRFPLMSSNELAMVVSPSGVLEPADLIAVFTYCSNQQSNVSTVGGFCTHPRQATFKGERMRFDIKKSTTLVTISSDGMSVSSVDKACGAMKMAITNVPYPKFGIHYFEVTLDHTHGCNDAVGVVHKKLDMLNRLGDTKTSWAVRVHGPSTKNQEYGAVHARKHSDFFKDWEKGDRIGVKFDVKKKTLTYYQNGKFLGTPFTNVEGEIYPAVEVCHAGSLTANFKAVAPRN